MVAVRKTISIPEKQDRWLRENSISLSKLAQEAIRRKMDLAFARLSDKRLQEIEDGTYEEMSREEFLEQIKR